jgi:hypothetical protein
MLLLVLVRDRNTWTLFDRKRQIYSISKCLFLFILPDILNWNVILWTKFASDYKKP